MQRLALAASAAILAVALVPVAHAADWDGFYVGGNLGYGRSFGHADYSIVGVPTVSGDETLKGAVYGGQAGYNFQNGAFVAGIEADIQATKQKASASNICITPVCGLLTVTQKSEDSLPWFATARARVGFALDRFFIYGTAGAGYGEFKSTNTLTTTLASITTVTSNERLAWVFGGGVEAAIDAHWRVRAEYLYLDTGTFDTTYSVAGIGLVTEKSRMTNNIVRLGLNYRF